MRCAAEGKWKRFGFVVDELGCQSAVSWGKLGVVVCPCR